MIAPSGPEAARPDGRAPLLVVMGVSGSGKSTVAGLLAARLRLPCADGDDFHDRANVATMAAGRALTEAQRAPWLRAVGGWLAAHEREGAVVSCSALRRAHRDVLREAAPRARFVHLTAPRAVLEARIGAREGHFMPATLLGSQLATLEAPGADEGAVTVDVSGTAEEGLAAALGGLGLGGTPAPGA